MRERGAHARLPEAPLLAHRDVARLDRPAERFGHGADLGVVAGLLAEQQPDARGIRRRRPGDGRGAALRMRAIVTRLGSTARHAATEAQGAGALKGAPSARAGGAVRGRDRAAAALSQGRPSAMVFGVAGGRSRVTAKPCVFIHTNHRQLVGALVSAHSFARNSAHADRFDVRIIHGEDYPFLRARDGQPYLREGERAIWRYEDLQSFTPLRFLPPQLLGYRGIAVVVDPDVFAVGDVWELLTRDMQGKAIVCRRAPAARARPAAWRAA